MGILYAKVGGTFVPIAQSGPQGPSGGPVPVGGAVGDVIIKSGAADFAVRWGYDPPKLSLTSSVILDLASTTHPLTLGPTTSYNVAISSDRIQCRNNGAVAVLRLNHYGGQVIVGGVGNTDQYLNTLQVAETAHATSRRAAIALGLGWGIGQDIQANGTKDFYIYQNANSRTSLAISADGLSVTTAGYLNIGNNLRLGGASGPTINTDGDYIHLNSDSSCYYDGNNHYWRSVGGGTSKMTLDGSHNLTVVGNVTANGNLMSGNSVYTGNNQWFRCSGQGGLFFEAYGGGFQMVDTTWIRTYGSKNFYCNSELRAQTLSFDGSCNVTSPGLYFRCYNGSDNNHKLLYANATPTGSGEASNGPQLSGYSSVWLYNMIGNKNCYMSSSGNLFLSAGCTYNVFSSRDFKHNIKTLDPERALLMVRRWNPVEYDWNEDLNTPHPHGFGFISEDHAEVLPEMCHIYGEGHDGPENERLVVHRPGWAAAVDYSGGVPWLAGAIQALLMRIEALETELEARKN
jgi:hypothetical protein